MALACHLTGRVAPSPLSFVQRTGNQRPRPADKGPGGKCMSIQTAFHRENLMQNQRKGVAFDVDAASLLALRQALPEWEIETVAGATPHSIDRDWNPTAMNLLVAGARDC